MEARARTCHGPRTVTTEAYLAEHERISRLVDGLADAPPTASGIDPDRAIARLADLKDAWAKADEGARAKLVGAICRRIIVEGSDFVGVELTAEAKAMGLAVGTAPECGFGAPGGTRTHDL